LAIAAAGRAQCASVAFGSGRQHFVLVDFAPAARIRELRNVRNDSATSITMESEQWLILKCRKADRRSARVVGGAQRKSKLKVEAPDKSDFAAAFRRMEIRTRLFDMKPDELANYFAKYGDNLPVEIAQAVIELPPEYSGVPQSRHRHSAPRPGCGGEKTQTALRKSMLLISTARLRDRQRLRKSKAESSTATTTTSWKEKQHDNAS
jgi:hypothetical protein